MTNIYCIIKNEERKSIKKDLIKKNKLNKAVKNNNISNKK